MSRHLAQPLSIVVLSSASLLLSTLACSSEDPVSPAMNTQTGGPVTNTSTSAGTTATTSPASTTATATTGGVATATVTSSTGAATTVTSTTGASTTTTGSTGAGGATATVTGATTTGATTTTDTTSTTGTATTGGASLTDEQCSGISNGTDCTTEGSCAPRSCGLADTGSRTCSCGAGTDCASGTCWDCTSCAWTEPYPEVVVPPETPLSACDVSVADEVQCATSGERCMQGEEVCACWLEKDSVLIWDCDNPPSFWP